MILPTVSVRKPVVAAVAALLLVVLGVGAALRMPVREYPDVDPPIVSVSVVFPGAAAEVVERDVTQIVEDNLSGIDGIKKIDSTSRAGFSQTDIQFVLSRDLDAAAADVRDKVSAIVGELPEEIDEPIISKARADADAMMWVTLTSDQRDRRALTDYAIRNLADPLSILPGVAQVVIGGERRYAMRVWLDAQRMAARGVTINDVAAALRRENLELPGGRIETGPRELTLRTDTKVEETQGFRELVIRDDQGYQVTLGDVAEVTRGTESYRSAVYRGGEPAIGLGIIRQSGSNTLSVANGVRAELDRLSTTIPDDIELAISYDKSIFIEGSIRQVVFTLLITTGLVVAVITLFLGSFKATLVPVATIPTSIIASFAVLYLLGFTINTLTLLAAVLAIGLVVDDAIVVLENTVRRLETGEQKLVAAMRGAGEVALAVIATTAVLVAVLLPISAITGMVGRLFTEFAIALAAAAVFSSFLALTLGAALASKVAEPASGSEGKIAPMRWFSRLVDRADRSYGRAAKTIAGSGWIAGVAAIAIGASSVLMLQWLPGELAPTEDRAVFIVPLSAPEGASLSQTAAAVREVEAILEPHGGADGPIEDTISIVGTGRSGPPDVTSALVIVKLRPWGERDISQQDLVEKITPKVLAIPGAQAVPLNPPSLVSESFGKPIQFVISGPDYQTAQRWAETVLERARDLGTMNNLELAYNERSPQVRLTIDRRLAADLGLSVEQVGNALRIFFGGDDVTEYFERGETYQVMVRGKAGDRDEPADVGMLNVRSATSNLVPLASVTTPQELGTAASYRRVDRQPSMVISAVPSAGADMGSILASLERIVEEELPDEARVNYLGLSADLQESSASIYAVFALALIVVYLTLAALFESFVYPIAILLAVPLAVSGGLAALLLAGMSFNTFSQIGLMLAVGLLAKNAILVVDFANQRRREGQALEPAIVEAARTRFRPVVMTSIATLFGAVPLALATGPGAEARTVIGVSVIAGVLGATFITLLIVPGLYRILARFGGVPGSTDRKIEEELEEHRTDTADAPQARQDGHAG
ncbi:efflux RND transporter permease subunit [Thalassobaculum sp.]|uniref:efflux RND transporter permease subunit n=1 Tax=Thalassobaculum sp. TaxID=2022740 RepID=UPI003B5A5875